MSENNMSFEESTSRAYDKLAENMPSIGIINRKKRIKAYIQVTKIAEYMITSEEITDENALLIFSIMMRKYADFQKAATMTALSLDSIAKNVLSPIGLKFALDIRRNLSLAPTHHTDYKPLEVIDKIDKDDQD